MRDKHNLEALKSEFTKLEASKLALEETLQKQQWRLQYLTSQAQALAWQADNDSKAKQELESVQAEQAQVIALVESSKAKLESQAALVVSARSALRQAELDIIEAAHDKAELELCSAWREVLKSKEALQALYDKIDVLRVRELELAQSVRSSGRTCTGFALPVSSDNASLLWLNERISELSQV